MINPPFYNTVSKGVYMTYICSIGISTPKHELHQSEVKDFVKNIFPRPEKELRRILPVFENASVDKRQFVMAKSWFKEGHSFKERNDLYQKEALEHSLKAIDDCLTNSDFLQDKIPYEAIDKIIFVSSTGISTPSLDAHILNGRNFRDDIVRLPLWGLGCAGGASGLARASEWLSLNKSSCALVVCVELCSLTFQKDDTRKSNFIGTALFGDGISAALLVGEQSSYLSHRSKATPKINHVSSKLKKNSLSVMGWGITNTGFEVIFSKSIPKLVETFWANHVQEFLVNAKLTPKDLSFLVAHPGGKKVLEAIARVLEIDKGKLKHSYNVLREHGNMSSATVFYILSQWMKEDVKKGEKSILSALGPGFSSELISMEWS